MADLAAALGLAIALEGMLYALFPAAMQRVMAAVLEQPTERLRLGGLAGAAVGVLLVWLVRVG
jgi:hypothetical protein